MRRVRNHGIDGRADEEWIWMTCTGWSSAGGWSLRGRSLNHRIARIAMTRATMSVMSRVTTNNRRIKPTATTARAAQRTDAATAPPWLRGYDSRCLLSRPVTIRHSRTMRPVRSAGFGHGGMLPFVVDEFPWTGQRDGLLAESADRSHKGLPSRG